MYQCSATRTALLCASHGEIFLARFPFGDAKMEIRVECGYRFWFRK
jgi:hypothetical protein